MKMMSVKQYAEKMASSESQIRQMCADGILPSVKIGKGYKIDVDRADAYFTEAINQRLADKPKVKRVVNTHKRKSEASFLERLAELKRGIGNGKDYRSNRIDSVGISAC